MADKAITIRTIMWQGQVAGSILCHSWGADHEVSYWLGKSYWGKGIATRALATLLEVVCDRPLYARVVEDHIPSIRV